MVARRPLFVLESRFARSVELGGEGLGFICRLVARFSLDRWYRGVHRSTQVGSSVRSLQGGAPRFAVGWLYSAVRSGQRRERATVRRVGAEQLQLQKRVGIASFLFGAVSSTRERFIAWDLAASKSEAAFGWLTGGPPECSAVSNSVGRVDRQHF